MAAQAPWRLRNAERDGMTPLRKQWQRMQDAETPGLAELKEAAANDPNGEDEQYIGREK